MLTRLTRTEEERTGSGHSPLVLQSETAHLVQGGVVGEVDAIGSLVHDVELDNEQLLQTVHGELNLATARHGVRGDLNAPLVSCQLFPVRERDDQAAEFTTVYQHGVKILQSQCIPVVEQHTSDTM